MPIRVNLDALIPREDFEVLDIVTSGGRQTDALTINNLSKNDFFFSAIRKPDFQRETSEWDPEKICDFIISFIEGDLIPAIILWRSKKLHFCYRWLPPYKCLGGLGKQRLWRWRYF